MANNEEKLLAYLKRVTGDLREARRRLADGEAAAHEPIAVIGMACRLPGGVASPRDLWDVVAGGRDAVVELPGDRGWDLEALYHPDPEHLGTTYVRRGGFVHDAGDFDAAFFGIGPGEAVGMAPQQRLALETAWEAIEHARIPPGSLRGTPTGAFVGCDGLDYTLGDAKIPAGAAGFFTTGNSASITSGRISYALGLEGPAVTLDTACSSSLVAIHLAAQALRRGECALALAGGAYVMASPAPLIGFSELGGLAPDGRSKPFSARADGMTLSEGTGMVLLERLSDARRNGRRILAVVRGSAVNQDGASNGLTAPNGPAQERVIRQALADARLAPSGVDAVEAHGTGTTLGDPIEAGALLATYGADRPDGRPLWLGSVKSNIGHTQITAGVAGVIKMVLALGHGLLPATLHAAEPSPHVDWDAGGLRLLTEAVPWPAGGRPRRAGVSSFGFSGTNAHLILEEAPADAIGAASPQGASPEPASPEGAGAVPWVVSAHGEAALRAQARRLCESPAADPVAVAWSLVTTRSAFGHRAVAVGPDPGAALGALARGEAHPDLVSGTAGEVGPGPVLVFPGQGSQWAGMGADLLGSSPVFAARIAECEGALRPHVDWSLTEVLRGDGSPLSRVDVVQPVLWAVMVSLAALWEHHGVRPAAVVGHSQGEIAAACVAGALTLEDAAKIVAVRARALRALSGKGTMASLGMGADQAAELIGDRDGVVIAAVNGPSSTVISGPTEPLAALVEAAQAQGLRARLIDVDYASHGPQIDQLTDTLTTGLAGVAPSRAPVAYYSAVTGTRVDTTTLDTQYWITNLRRPVRFADAVGALLDDGHRVFIEASSHPVLSAGMQECFELADVQAVTVPTLRRSHGGPVQVARAAGQAFAAGVEVDWTTWFPSDPPPPTVDLPTYAFQRRRYWVEHAPPGAAGGGGHDAAEARLWKAVEDGDPEAVAAALRLNGDGAAAGAIGPALPVLSAWRREHREQRTVDACRYRVTWTRLEEAKTRTPSGTWLLLVPAAHAEGSAARTVAEALGDRAVVAVCDETERGPLARRLADLAAGPPPAGVVSLLGLDETPHAGHPAVPNGLAATTALVQALGDAAITAPLWCVTQGAVAVNAADAPVSPAQAQVWGLGRVAALEHPRTWGGLIDLPAAPDAGTPARFAAVLAAGPPEDQVAIRSAAAWARRLVHAPPQEPDPAAAWRPAGTTLVTGGTGGIGARLALWLAREGAPHLVLTSRRGADAPGAPELAAELKALGTAVTIAACDAGDREAVRGVLDGIPADLPLTAVVHAAGVSTYAPVADLTPRALDEVLRPKSHAAQHLHELTRHMDLSAFVLFSSGAATWGSGQQAAYAAANSHLDALAEHRRAQGLPATSVAWGAWGEVGMASDDASLAFFSRFGLHPVPPDLAIRALHQAVSQGATTLTVADIDWERFTPTFTAQRPAPLLDDLPENDPSAGADGAASATPLVEELTGLPPGQRMRALLGHVQAQAAAAVGLPSPDAVPPGRPFQELGFDSLSAVQLRNQLNAATGLRLPTTLVFDHPTPQELASHLHGRLVADDTPTEDTVMAELDRWEAAWAADEADEAARRRIGLRMRALLARWTEGGTGRPDRHQDLETATAEDIFDVISTEFGKS
ncbi:SDR family NAD(P)-dependent oxidoreductase [Actinomadura graeca]|uniref:SDR family NAD(P)-dependent oxidoreductase n=1 Tax=Actinomadura graeca TaxID=2750812 RepID=A0ABX8R4Y2_9ACTN|nr:type I polyketide synthase [Actinomadura graeca]QXJ26136.1 SDR family NAD(P)-dependent oxidoreductase [Actinomadura graeca]